MNLPSNLEYSQSKAAEKLRPGATIVVNNFIISEYSDSEGRTPPSEEEIKEQYFIDKAVADKWLEENPDLSEIAPEFRT